MARPIKFHEHIQLTNVGIRPANICFANVTMESDEHVVAREMGDGIQELAIVHIKDQAKHLRLTMAADSARMNSSKRTLALKSEKRFRLIDLNKMIEVRSEDMEDVIFCTWLNEGIIALISDTAVYYWTIDGNSTPQKMFDRHASLAGNQIISYRADFESKWLVIIGISTKDNRVTGSMQLYGTEEKVSRPIEGHAACFVRFKANSNPSPSNLLCFSVKNEDGGKLRIIEVGQPAAGNQPFADKDVYVPYTADTASNFLVSMQASSQHGIIYLVTKHGFVHLYDIETGARVSSSRISNEILAATMDTSTGGIMGVNWEGQVFSISIDETNMSLFLADQLRDPDLALRLASRSNFPGGEEFLERKFNFLFESGQHDDAAEILFQSAKEPIIKWLIGQKLECCEELGDIVRPHDAKVALAIYLRGNAPHKVIQCFAETGQFDKIILYGKRIGFKPEFQVAVAKSEGPKEEEKEEEE